MAATDQVADNAESNARNVADCLNRGILFEDDQFPAASASIGLDESTDANYKWLRPHQISSSPEFIRHGFSRSDIGQGQLGNCWILASLAGLAERPLLIDRVVVPGQEMQGDEYCGAFKFRLWQFGRLVEVMVDDRLPTSSGEPVFAQPIQDEFWVCLLEKALAKLYGSYSALEGGLIFEALADMTGGVCEEIKLNDDSSDLDNSELAKHITKCASRGCVIGASSVQSETGDDYEMDNGLVYSHAYTVTGAERVQAKSDGRNSKWRNIDLVRVRNPWGCAEWRGDWSDGSIRWSDEQRRSVGVVQRDDGEFWMSLVDFRQFFASLTILHLPLTDEREEGEAEEAEEDDEESTKVLAKPSEGDWHCRSFNGAWVKGRSAGGQPCYTDTHRTNPQFLIHLKDSAADADDAATCLVSLEEPDQRRRGEPSYVPKAVFVYEARPGKKQIGKRCQPVADSCPFNLTRTHVARFRLQPGAYVFVPCTHEPNQEAEFLLRVFTEA